MGIIIGADIVPTKSNQEMFNSGNAEMLIGEKLLSFFHQADYRILNMEVPLAEKETPILKCGRNFIASTQSVKAIKNMGINLVTLANNHILDQDAEGLFSTVHCINAEGIAHVGVGKNLREAKEPFFFTVKGKRYGVYACTEHEFSIAEEDKPGANPFDPLYSSDCVEQMKKKCDYAIVLYHGGKEHYRYPSPMLQKTCRRFIEKGANLVICQHSHCIGCEEDYLNGKILYGQGNFLFDHGDNDYRATSLLVEITEAFEIVYHPIKKEGPGVRMAEGEIRDKILQDFASRSEEIKVPGTIEKKYKEFAMEKLPEYVWNISGMKRSFLYRICNKLLGNRLDRNNVEKYLLKSRMEILNFTECEAHRELMIEGLKRYTA